MDIYFLTTIWRILSIDRSGLSFCIDLKNLFVSEDSQFVKIQKQFTISPSQILEMENVVEI